jgi:hypothetical protein
MISRFSLGSIPATENPDLAARSLAGEASLADPGTLAELRGGILAAVAQDVPKYPALAYARKKWTGEN